MDICYANTLRPRQNGRCFADDTFKHIFLNENVRILIKISLKFVPKGPINNNPALVQITAWRRSGDKPLSEPMIFSLLIHICVTRPQWVNKSQILLDTQDKLMNPTASTDCYVMVWLQLVLPISFRITSGTKACPWLPWCQWNKRKEYGRTRKQSTTKPCYVLYDVSCSTEAQEL